MFGEDKMNYKKHYKMVEGVLKEFPVECRRNYIMNKENVTIKKKRKPCWKNITGTYNNEKNEITIYQSSSLPHELFHMAFRDKEKVGKKLWEDKDMYYDNGVSYATYKNGMKLLHHQGLTEGFAEYLSRKCCDCRGQDINYFFVDLLISIYGEDILKYPLQNDPKGLLLDERFFDIFEFSRNLDGINDAEDIIQMIATRKETFEEILTSNNKEDILKFREIFIRTEQKFKFSHISLFKSIINEYEYCPNPMINRKDFTNKLETFLNDPAYKIAFGFDDNKCSVREKVTEIINEFKGKNSHYRKTIC